MDPGEDPGINKTNPLLVMCQRWSFTTLWLTSQSILYRLLILPGRFAEMS